MFTNAIYPNINCTMDACAAACAAPGTFVIIPLPFNGKLEIRPSAAAACAPQGPIELIRVVQ